jgi:hypothetical protein
MQTHDADHSELTDSELSTEGLESNRRPSEESSDTDDKEIARQSLLERQFLSVLLRAIYLTQQAEELSSTGGGRMGQVHDDSLYIIMGVETMESSKKSKVPTLRRTGQSISPRQFGLSSKMPSLPPATATNGRTAVLPGSP